MANWKILGTSKYFGHGGTTGLHIEAWRSRKSSNSKKRRVPAKVAIATRSGEVSLSLSAAKWLLENLARAIEYADTKPDKGALGFRERRGATMNAGTDDRVAALLIEIDAEGPQLECVETIAALNGWENHGEPLAAVEVTVAAVYWLSRADLGGAACPVIAQMALWLLDDSPKLPDSVGEEALHWLQSAYGAG